MTFALKEPRVDVQALPVPSCLTCSEGPRQVAPLQPGPPAMPVVAPAGRDPHSGPLVELPAEEVILRKCERNNLEPQIT